MEDILKRLLELRQQRLEACVEDVNTTLGPDGRINIGTAKAKMTQLKTLISKLDGEIKNYTSKSIEPALLVVEKAMQIQLRAEDLMADMEIAMSDAEAVKERFSTKLPQLELCRFDGNKLKWNEFWDKFKSSVHARDIANVDKMSYLLSCLEGTAADALAGLPTSTANYPIAIETLQRRFGANDLLIDSHYMALNGLPRAAYTSGSCRATLDRIEQHIRVLETLGEEPNGNHLRSVILAKFPDPIVHEMHIMCGTARVNMAEMRSHLNVIITAMERTSLSHDAARDGTTDLVPSVGIPGSSTEALHVQTQGSQKHNNNRKRKFTRENGHMANQSSSNKRARRACLFCKLSNHASADCRKFKTIEARKEKLKGRCFNCLRQNHSADQCKRKISCYRCKGSHLQVFCPASKTTGKEPSTENDRSPDIVSCISHGFTYLQTAVTKICNPKANKEKSGRVLMDSGSQRSYITARMARSLGLPTDTEDTLLIYTFGASTPQEVKSPSTEVIVETKRGVKRQMQVNVVDHITDRIPIAMLKQRIVDVPADDNTASESIDLLVGNDYYCSFIREGKQKISSNLHLIDTDFGWVVSGNDELKETPNSLAVTTYCQCHLPSCPYFTEPDLPLRSVDIKFLWSLESIGITDNPKATRQEEAVRHFNETVLYQDGRYQVKWPWIQYPPELPSNYGLAYGRLKSLMKRTDKPTLEEYDTILHQHLTSNIIEVAEKNTHGDHPLHYLPHHMVKQAGKAGRIVYDASAKTTGHKSLNECLYSGPSMLEDLTALLLQFRTRKVGIVADVEKAFLQVGLQEEDRDVTRFLWVKDIKKEPSEDNLLHLRFCRVPFGVISSPFLLTATIRHHMSQSDENLRRKIADKCYVDNLVTSIDTVEEAELIYKETRTMFEQLSMNIRDWTSNNEDFLNAIPKEHRAKQMDQVKILGLLWELKGDTLKLNISDGHFKPETQVDTKRKVLRALSRVYDPFGFVCPLILPMKLLFQEICENKLKWDTELPKHLKQLAETTLENLKIITQFEIPRYLGIPSPSPDTNYELHCFCDASKNAYAAVVYLRAEQQKEIVSVAFIMAKSRISRTEDKTELRIPRLELLGFLIGSRLLTYIRNNIGLDIKNQYLWTDSQVVLGWINSNKLLPPFVANRVNEIKNNHRQTKMFYINTKSNPADIATRPESWQERKDLWDFGPTFLKLNESGWPDNRHYEYQATIFSVGEVPGESRGRPSAVNGQDKHVVDVPLEMDCVEVQESCYDSTLGSVTEIKQLQQQYFPEELTGKRTHLTRNLDLFLDVDGLLRCRGRMANTTWSYDMKYPILLPKDCGFTNHMIKDTHEKNYHVGAAHTLSIIRERYWIPQGKVQVQKVIRRCTQCTKHGGGPCKLPGTPALPPERVNFSTPFTFTGVDYFGPMYVSTPTGKEKRWVALFTCLAVRAVHLEIVKDLSAEECLLALRRFAATRGVPKRMYSDNATCFKLTSEVMSKPFCIEHKIEWRFIPQLAPWHGGFYERLVAVVKHCLKRTLEKHLLNDSKLLTVMKEVEAVVNTRPITQIGSEINHTLRPSDFLTLGRCLTMRPAAVEAPLEGSLTKTELIQSWRRGLMIVAEFKRMFIGQYLISLRERSKHLPKQPRVKTHRNPQIGDIVQIWSDSKNRENWKVGKITALIEGTDGEIRVARVETKDSTLTRSIGHLYPLEADYDKEQGDLAKDQVTQQSAGPNSSETIRDPEVARLEDSIPNDNPLSCEEVHQEATVNPEISTPMEVEFIQAETEEAVTEEELEASKGQTMAADGIAQLPNEPRADEVRERSRRDAAIRASERIREWTRHLLTLLQ